MNKQIYKEWTKINIELENRLKELEKMDKEKNNILKEAEENGMSEELKRRMDESISKYENLSKEVRQLNLKSKQLKELL